MCQESPAAPWPRRPLDPHPDFSPPPTPPRPHSSTTIAPLPHCRALPSRQVEYYSEHGWHSTNLLPFVDHRARAEEIQQAQQL